MDDNQFSLPPGFRFCPTDEELVVNFLQQKASLLTCHPGVIPDLELNPYDPWDLDGKAMPEGNKWYFFSRKTPVRITENGYWMALGTDEPIISSTNKKIGWKKYHIFYLGEASNQGIQTNWIMEEYRLIDSGPTGTSRTSSTRQYHQKDYSKWVLCRVYEHGNDGDETELSSLDEVFLSLDDNEEVSFPN